jgi:nitroreductase
MGLQLMKFLVIVEPELKKKITPIAFNQKQVEDCSHLIVLCRKNKVVQHDIDSFIEETATTREIETQSETMVNFRKMLEGSLNIPAAQQHVWMENQVYLALGNLLTLCASENVDSCPMEGFDRKRLDELLGLENEGLNAVVLCPIGYRSEQDKYSNVKKVRRPLHSLVQER